MKHRKQRERSTCPLLKAEKENFIMQGLIPCCLFWPLAPWFLIGVTPFRELWLTRTLHPPVLPATDVSAPTGWWSATLQSYRKTEPSCTTSMWQSMFSGSELLAGHNNRLFFSHMCFICAVCTNTFVFKRFPDPSGTHGRRDPKNAAKSSTRPKIPKLIQSDLNVSYWDCSQVFGLEIIGLLVNLRMLASKHSP